MSNARNIASGAKFVDTAGDSMTGALSVSGGANSAHLTLSGSANRGLKISTSNPDGQNDGTVILNAQDTEASGVYAKMAFQTAGTERMKIDNAGRVTMPNQPAFHVIDLAFSTGGSSNGTGGTVKTNRGSRYSAGNGRFTAPVAGVYYFWGAIQHFQSGSSTYIGMSFYKNGSQDTTEYVSGVGGSYNNHQMETGGYLASLNVNDYVNINANRGARNGIQSAFLGYLIG
tara:strand:+ start:55 stop:741 length:687 start_codon:yes stop_codon:yes gene_type:complete